MKDTLPARVRFAGFELDPKTGELRGGGQTVRLTEKPFRVLSILAEHGGELVTREEIQKRLWPNDTIVDFEHGINTAIKILRRALGDFVDEPKYIETLPRRGYRLMVPVEWIAVAEDSPGEAGAEIAGGAGDAVRMQPDPGALTFRTVSHYRVLDIIGGGGMGVVYRAEDLKLGRRVALKFLPEELGNEPQALERFSREARAVSSLDHPNICSIFEFGEHEGRPFMVMQLLEGQTLRDRLAEVEGPLPLEESLDIALQVSEGLQAAHERGIIHRDIKPANIFVTNKGICKILDFGLAKLLELGDEEQAAAAAPTKARKELREHGTSRVVHASSLSPSGLQPATDLHLTRTGAAMGTAGYMSPEQVRGEKLDARTDLFSFGLVLYEMATSQRAFSGETAEMVHDAVLHQPQIPVHDLNSKLPPELETIINKALEKDQTAAEMGADLKRLHRGAESAIHKPTRYSRVLLSWGAALAIALLAFGLALRWFKEQRIGPGKTLSERLLTHNPEENPLIGAAISPDGKHMAYIGSKGLHLSVIETGEIHDVPLPEELRTHLSEVTWFPDGEKLILTAESDAEGRLIWVTSVFGGAPHRLRSGRFPAASPEGTLIAFVSGHDHEIWVMGANGENPHRILAGENDTYGFLAWSPTSQRLAYIKTAEGNPGGSIETVSLDGGPPSVVVSDTQPKNSLLWGRDGRMTFVWHEGPWSNSGANLWVIMADPATGEPSGRATKITDWDGAPLLSVTFTRDATRLALVKMHLRVDVYVGELKDGGTRLASPTRLTVSESQDYATGWTLDSKTILFLSNRTGRNQIFRQQLEQGVAELLISGPDDETTPEMSPDGRWILYWSSAFAGRGSGMFGLALIASRKS
jgi:serine/threonine protein kinase